MMEKRIDKIKAAGCGAVILLYVAAIVVALVLICACTTTKYVPVESVRTEYVDRGSARVDSVTLRDSIVIQSGADTVRIEKWRWREKISFMRDTLTIIKTDSVQVPFPVEKELSRWQKTKMDLGGIAIGACCAVILWLIVWIARRLRSKN